MSDNGYVIASWEDFQPQAQTVQLPSQAGTDKAVKLQRPDLVQLIKGDGEIPDVLTSLVLATIGGGQAQAMELNRETVPDMMESINVIAVATFVEPKLCMGSERQGDAIPASWIDFNDRAWVMGWALGAEYVPVQRFHREQGAGVESVPKGKAIRNKSK